MPCAGADAKGAVVEITHIVIRQRHRLFDAQEARLALGRRGLRRISQRRDIHRGRTVEVVDAADIDQARRSRATRSGSSWPVDRLIEDHRRQHARLCRHDVADQHVLRRRKHRHLGIRPRIVDPDAVERRMPARAPGAARADVGTGHDLVVDIQQPAGTPAANMRLVPSHSGKAAPNSPPGEIPSSVRTSLTTARVCAGPLSRPALAAVGCRFSTKLSASIAHQVAAVVIGLEGPDDREDPAIRHFARLRELDGRAIGAGIVAAVRRSTAPVLCRPGSSGTG